jgi:hypothetical protein
MQNINSPAPLPEIFISKETLDSRIQNYLTDKLPLLRDAQKNKGVTREETKSIWYSKEHIENWLREINLLNADGMRICFGAYGENENIVSGQLCLVMVLTRPIENTNSHSDIVYENEPDFTARVNATSNARSLTNPVFNDGSKEKQFNYGSPCPPIC